MGEWIFDHRILRRFRIASERTQGQAAKKVGVTQGMYCQWENGQIIPSTTSLLKICNAFNINPDLLFKREEIERLHGKGSLAGVSIRQAEAKKMILVSQSAG